MIARRFSLSTVFLLLLTLLLTACGGDEPQPVAVEPAPPPPHPWDVFIEDQIEAHLEAHPAWAVTQGRHEFDGQLPDWSEAGLQAEVQRLRQARRDAMAFVDADLSPEQQFQRDYFVSRIDHDLFWRVKARWPFRNPEFYFGWLSDSLDPAPYITLDYAPVEERMAAFTRYLEALPEAARQIRSNLRMPMPETWLQLGIDSFSGYASYFRDEVPAVWAEVDDEALQARFRAANEQAIASMTELAEWLELGRSIADQSFALGPALYEEMLWDTERVRIDLKELEEAARADMQRNLAALRNACAEFAPGQDLRPCMDKMSARKPAGGSVAAARAQLDETRAFLEQADLVSIPGTETALVEESPPYNRSNFAYINIPGPWEENQPSVYYISPPNPAWSEDVQRSFVAGESDLLFTSVHEVWPGHFLNFMHANRAPWLYGRAFVTYAYAEGWAHYTEELMLEAGLRDADAETRIGQLSNALLRNARFLASIGLHTQGWTVQEAQVFFMDEAYQSEGTAMQQAARGTYDPAYLNYTLGKLMIRRLREDWTAERGGREAWREFHDTFLTYGGPPIPLVRQQMLGEAEPLTVLPEPVTVIEALPTDLAPVAPVDAVRQLNWAWDCVDGRYLVSSANANNPDITLFLDNEPRDMTRVRAASGARYETKGVVFWTRGEEARLEIDGVATTCRVNPFYSKREDAKLRGADFRATGNEPGWHLELFSSQESVLVTDYGEQTLRFMASAPEAMNPGPGSVFTGRSGALDIRVELTPGPCQDTMIDFEYETTVLVDVGGRILRGCGDALH
jgi:membrane-bound inhibitor of C-type lysozyme